MNFFLQSLPVSVKKLTYWQQKKVEERLKWALFSPQMISFIVKKSFPW